MERAIQYTGTQLPFLLATVSILAFANTLHADFAFDDNYAIQRNRDVMDPAASWWGMMQHDFWGQNIWKPDSHKSYRPVSAMLFRLSRMLEGGLVASGFHVHNVLLHAVASILLYAVAEKLFARVWSLAGGASTRAALAALIFAVHPVHCEAVAGVVGRAEINCCIFMLWSLLHYMHAVSRRTLDVPQLSYALVLALLAVLAKENGIATIGILVLYELLDMALPAPQADAEADADAVELDSAASPLRRQGSGKKAPRSQQTQKPKLKRGAGRPQAYARQFTFGVHCRLWRMACVLVAGVAYLVFRKKLLVKSVVDIYRQVENYVPFMQAGGGIRTLNVAHLHALYAGLLVFPKTMSADWSYSCIKPLLSWKDPRVAMPAVLYAVVGGMVLYGVLMPLVATRAVHGAAAGLRLFLLLSFVLGPFLPGSNIFFYVGTFIGERLLYLPSIGFCLLLADALETFRIGDAADKEDAVGAIHATASSPPPPPLEYGGGAGTPKKAVVAAAKALADEKAAGQLLDRAEKERERNTSWRASVTYAMVAALLVGYSMRAVRRNNDWQSETHLFVAALDACPDSAKVRLNNGILERRTFNWPKAMQHFRHAAAIDPTYCEPTYWMGLTVVSMVDPTRDMEGVALLEQAVECVYVRVEAVKALNMIYLELNQRYPERSGVYLEAWARILERVDRPDEACTYFHEAAAVYKAAGNISAADIALRQCSEKAATTVSCITLQAEAQKGDDEMFQYIYHHADTCRESPGHVRMLHAAHAKDVYNPWMQLEWGETILAMPTSRPGEAALHLNAAGKLFLIHAQEPGHVTTEMFSWYTQRRDFGGLSKRDLILKGVFAFEKAIALNAETISKCQLQIELMEAQSQLVAHTDVELERTLLIHNSHLLLQDVLRRPECSTYKEVLPKQLIDSVAEHM